MEPLVVVFGIFGWLINLIVIFIYYGLAQGQMNKLKPLKR